MTPGTTEIHEVQKESRTHSAAWIGAAVGAGIGIAALAYRRRPRNSWDRARDRARDSAGDLLDTVRKDPRPWIGAAAGTAAAGTALALYMRRPNESGWKRAGKRAGEIASRVGTEAIGPKANLAAAAAIGLASLAYANRARRRTIRGIDANTAEKINTLTERGLQILRRARSLSERTGKLYPRLRDAIA